MRDRRQVLQDLRPGGLVVRQRVGLVAVLVEHHPVGVVRRKLLRHPDRLVGPARRGRGDDLGAVHLEQLPALGRRVLRHHADQPVAPQLRHHRQRDPGVPRGRLQQREPRLQQPVLLRLRDHIEGRAVLHRAGGVAVLELGPQPRRWRGRQPRQPDQRGPAERVEQRVVTHGSVRQQSLRRPLSAPRRPRPGARSPCHRP